MAGLDLLHHADLLPAIRHQLHTTVGLCLLSTFAGHRLCAVHSVDTRIITNCACISRKNYKSENMETLLGIKGPDFVMVAADSTQAQSIIMMKEGTH